MTDRYVVTRHPRAHSLSPAIHAARQSGQDMGDEKNLATLDGFVAATEASLLWRGIRPATAPVLKALQAEALP